jgi:hypothetical protein
MLTLFLSGMQPGGVLLVQSIVSFLRNLHINFHSGCLIYIPTNSVWRFLFIHIPANIWYVFLTTIWSKMKSQCRFDLLDRIWWLKVLNILHVFIGNLYFFWEPSLQFFSSFVTWTTFSFDVQFLCYFYFLDINPLPDGQLADKDFLPFCRLSIHFNVFSSAQKLLIWFNPISLFLAFVS